MHIGRYIDEKRVRKRYRVQRLELFDSYNEYSMHWRRLDFFEGILFYYES